MRTEQTYKTRSLILAAYLLATGKVKLLGVDKNNPREVFFVFSSPQVCEQLISDYWSDSALVNPKLLNTKLTELKDQIFN